MSGKYAANERQLDDKCTAILQQPLGHVTATTQQSRGNHAANERQLAQK
jgi:hypothetical protein